MLRPEMQSFEMVLQPMNPRDTESGGSAPDENDGPRMVTGAPSRPLSG